MLHLDGKTVICALGQRANHADVEGTKAIYRQSKRIFLRLSFGRTAK